jgi:hypothetical protein
MLDAGPFITSIEIGVRFFPRRGSRNEVAAAIRWGASAQR